MEVVSDGEEWDCTYMVVSKDTEERRKEGTELYSH
jgi:hypothetical protein